MVKKHDTAWAEEMKDAMPPVRYALPLYEAALFMNMKAALYGVVAAYNYGFRRGQAYEEKKGREKGP